jgi:hypothetical protein
VKLRRSEAFTHEASREVHVLRVLAEREFLGRDRVDGHRQPARAEQPMTGDAQAPRFDIE